MPEFSNRGRYENEVARYLRREFDRIKEELVQTYGSLAPDAYIPSISQIDLLGNQQMTWLEDKLEDVYLDAAREFMESIHYEIDQNLLLASAQAWAADRARNQLVATLNQTTSDRVQAILSQFQSGGMTNETLINRLSKVVRRDRAVLIAITEVTRAASEGQQRVANHLREQGVNLTTIWNTLVDERVCPICGPRNGMAQGTNWFDLPPAHPRCRCFVTFRNDDA